MSAAFWVRRFLLVFVGAAIIIASAQLLNGHTFRYSLAQAALLGRNQRDCLPSRPSLSLATRTALRHLPR
jgi:hypothetical protein